MSQKRITSFIDTLSKYPAAKNISNPYHAAECRNNLREYLLALIKQPYSGHLLIGEAPGRRGCAVTGIPFTSNRVLKDNTHQFIVKLRRKLEITGSEREQSPKIVWEYLEKSKKIPACWNVFPFHSHEGDARRTNRKPSNLEITNSKHYLFSIIEILSPSSLIAVGRKAEYALERWLPQRNYLYVRHPANGGKPDFIRGLKSAGIK